ncbi:MAG TPA: hypothetical protein VFW25_14095 [Silvibacterium sp.]|nr:hypothetical protein [Silvibacterium sp.]
MVRRPVEFIKTAGLFGGGSVTLAIILFLITGLEHYWNQNVTATVFAALGIIFFCFGAFTAWNKERDKYEAEVTKTGNPSFVLDPGQMHVWYDINRGQTMILLSPTLTNHGATSAAFSWQISFNSSMLRIQVPYSSLPDSAMRWIVPPGNRALVLRNDKMLPFLTAEAVERGHSKSGRILFELPGNLERDILANPASLYLGCSNRLNQLTWQGLSQSNIMSEFAALPGEEYVALGVESPARLAFPGSE